MKWIFRTALAIGLALEAWGILRNDTQWQITGIMFCIAYLLYATRENR